MHKLSYSSIVDISLTLSHDTIVYPNNPLIEIDMFKNPSGLSYLSKISFGSHSGTHIDAPRHVFENGASIDTIPLEAFIGHCRVLDLTISVPAIMRGELEAKKIHEGERILFKTKNSLRGYTRFYNDYIFVSSDAAQYLASRRIAMVGIDYVSIKQKGSKDNTPHTAFLGKNIPILEGIDLSKVEEGEYFLVVLPLKFAGIEASPARAVLLK